MILIDFNQVVISSMVAQMGNHQNAKIDINMLRHMVINSIRANRVKFHRDYGELILCCDDSNYWRKDIFPYYKANRSKDRESSEIDWNAFFIILNEIRGELKEYMPYKVMHIERAEADDSIGTIVHKEGRILGGEPILIISGDHDFRQLQKYGNVKQFDPKTKRFIVHNNPEEYLIEHIIKGDRGDGIPNILSDGDTFVNPDKRQKTMTAGRLKKYKDINNIKLDDLEDNYNRNKTCVDLSLVRDDIKQAILDEYNIPPKADRPLILNYFTSKRLKLLVEDLNQF